MLFSLLMKTDAFHAAINSAAANDNITSNSDKMKSARDFDNTMYICVLRVILACLLSTSGKLCWASEHQPSRNLSLKYFTLNSTTEAFKVLGTDLNELSDRVESKCILQAASLYLQVIAAVEAATTSC